MARSSLRLDLRRALKDGTFPVQIKVGFGTNLYLKTGIYLKQNEWNEALQICIGRDSRRINSILGSQLLRAENQVLELMETGYLGKMTSAQLRRYFLQPRLSPQFNRVPSLEKCIKSVQYLKAGNTRETYETLSHRLNRYCKADILPVNNLSYAWFEGFRQHLQNSGLRHNTVAKYIKTLKTVLKYAEEEGLPVNPAYRKVSSRADTDTPMRDLPLDTLRRIRDTPIPGKMARYRDAFLLSFYLIGINPGDLLSLPKDCIVNGRLHYRRAKTGKNYSILVEPEAWDIIGRYPGDHCLLNFGEESRFFRQNCNDYLKHLAPGLTWYWARYSWAGYAVDLDIPKDIISEALGHKHGSDVTGIYIRYSLDKVDRANRMVLDYFAGRR